MDVDVHLQYLQKLLDCFCNQYIKLLFNITFA